MPNHQKSVDAVKKKLLAIRALQEKIETKMNELDDKLMELEKKIVEEK